MRQTGGLALGDLDQVELLFAGLGQRFGQGADPQLLAVGTDEEDLAGSDAVVDPDLVCSYVVTCFIGDLLDGGSGTRTRRWRTREMSAIKQPPASGDGGRLRNMRTRRTWSVAWCWWPGGDPGCDPTSL